MDDKAAERDRYEARARLSLESPASGKAKTLGSAAIAPTLRDPYVYYEQQVRELISPGQDVLELGAGWGLHTAVLLGTGARVTATDISPGSLALLKQNLAGLADERLATRVADMESLPFDSHSFDVVACAGSLSYGDAELVDSEVRRVLRRGGAFVCVDSLNHNPVYRLNRWLQYVRGDRSRSTLLRMPGVGRIASIGRHFDSIQVRYFGALTWAAPPLSKMIGEMRASRALAAFDGSIGVKRSAFKFVLVAKGCRG